MNRRVIVAGGISLVILAAAIYFRKKILRTINATMGNYFTIAELCASTVAKQKGIDNTPSEAVKENLQKLIDKLLNPIRETYGKPIVVSSGYRCKALNDAVRGVANSQHLTGQAADLVPESGNGTLKEIFKAAIAVGGYDQLIWEHGKNGAKWVHVSYAASPRKQMLAYDGSKYTEISMSNYERYLV